MKIPTLQDYPTPEFPKPPPDHSSCPCADPATLWPETKGPAVALERGAGRSWRSWLDHRWRFRNNRGELVWVVEPYHMDNEAIHDLAWLSERGWDILVTPAYARHFPGATVAVLMIEPTRVTQAGTADE